MGIIESKNNEVFSFSSSLKQCGFSSREIECFQAYLNNLTDPYHKIDHHEFKNFYSQLNPQLNDQNIEEVLRIAFSDIDNELQKFLTFDELIVFYIIQKSSPEDLSKNMKIFLNHLNDNSGSMTPKQATRYSKNALAYRLYYEDKSISSRAALAQIFYFYCYENIKIDEFVNQNFKKELWSNGYKIGYLVKF
jgi:hypothetical protein